MDILINKSFKYELEELASTSEEFILVKQFYDITSENIRKKLTNKTSSCNKYENHTNVIVENYHIYKVNENCPITSVNKKRNNLMLFHGTNKKGATGILKEGFKNSKRGWFGQAVYMTDCSYTAQEYSQKFDLGNKLFIFVNEVRGSEKLEIFKYDFITGPDIDTELKNPFNKHMSKSSRRLSKKDYNKDLLGRKYRNVAVDRISSYDEYVADESVTIPCYLIVVEQEWKKTTNSISKLVVNLIVFN